MYFAFFKKFPYLLNDKNDFFESPDFLLEFPQFRVRYNWEAGYLEP